MPNIHTLKSGLTLVTDYIDTVETVSVGMWNKVGARNEHQEVNGVAHLLEHMAFKGTHNRSALDIAKEVEMVGGGSKCLYFKRSHSLLYESFKR